MFTASIIGIVTFLSLAAGQGSEDKCALNPGPSHIRCYYCHFTYNENAYDKIPDDNDKDPDCITIPNNATSVQCPLQKHRFCQVKESIEIGFHLGGISHKNLTKKDEKKYAGLVSSQRCVCGSALSDRKSIGIKARLE